MAVTTTVQDILTAAYARSSKNQPGKIATEATELVKLVGRALRGLFAVGAVVNPEFFADSADVAYADPGWARPEDAISVWAIENATGDEVVVVPFSDRKAEEGKAALYRWGQIYRSPLGTNDPAITETLTFFYSARATLPTATSTVLDALWVEQHNDLLIDEVAIYLALKDGRGDEVSALQTERAPNLALFVSFLQHETVNEVRRYGQQRTILLPSLLPLLAGGGAN